ncbi:MAG TPA: polysaccharide pyruvyl transferase CsaB [Clostridia bacterium]|nr:polysaccharide pyruvyl transferase CsaB [Clostridia bacterium]
MLRAVISGYYGFHNSGDEAMLQAIIEVLGRRLPELELVVLTQDPDFTTGEFGVKSVQRDKPWRVWNEIRKSDLLISGGGGLLQDITGPYSIIYYLGIIFMAKLLGKPVFFYAQGVGPVRTIMGKILLRIIGNRVDFITVRDADSRMELFDLGLKNPPVVVTADPVLAIDTTVIDKERGMAIVNGLFGTDTESRPTVGISVRSWRGLTEFKKIVAAAADDLAARGWNVILVPMHYPDDLEACRCVQSFMKQKSVLLEERYEYRDLLAVVANMDLVIGMRLHFLIFGAVSNVPVIGISYDPKVNRFIELIRQPLAGDVYSLNYDELSGLIDRVIKDKENIKVKLAKQVKELGKESVRTAELLTEFLREKGKLDGP